jgi:hypothetical protein
LETPEFTATKRMVFINWSIFKSITNFQLRITTPVIRNWKFVIGFMLARGFTPRAFFISALVVARSATSNIATNCTN